jgi:hypothetical protein
MLQTRYNEREIRYKRATIAGEIGRLHWKMKMSCGEAPHMRGCVSPGDDRGDQRGRGVSIGPG